MDQSRLGINNSGFLTFWSHDPFTLGEGGGKDPQSGFYLCEILKIDIYFIINENLKDAKNSINIILKSSI